jgi:phosphopentomutase
MRIFLIILDGVGIGALPDAAEYGDAGTNTLLHVAQVAGGLKLPELEKLGLGRLLDLPGVRLIADPSGARGRLGQVSKGKDSTVGHWELAGHITDRPFPTYPHGFPEALLDRWVRRVGRGWMANAVGSGTDIIEHHGLEHQRSSRYIVYTSADSVFQVAAHEETVPLEELYEACRRARVLLEGEHGVGRVIARPFAGEPGKYRRDFSLEPPQPTLLDQLVGRGEPVITVGKVDELFAGRGVSESLHTKNNAEGMETLTGLVRKSGHGLVFANLVDFDMHFGHRSDPVGFARALEEFDERFGELRAHLRNDEMCLITADHGNDPTDVSTDHSREYAPLLVAGPRVRAGADLGTRETSADVAATIAEAFGVSWSASGRSFLKEVRS